MATATEETRKEIDAAAEEIERIKQREAERPVSADDQAAIDAANALGDTERSIEDMAGDDDEPAPVPPMRQPLVGSQLKIPSKMGGLQPTESEIRLLGGKLPIDGAFLKGDELLLLVRVKVQGAGEFDAMDDWGGATKTTRRHFARMVEVRRLEPRESGGGYELAGQQVIDGL